MLPTMLPSLFSSSLPEPTSAPAGGFNRQNIPYPPTDFVRVQAARAHYKASSSGGSRRKIKVLEEDILNTLLAVEPGTSAADSAWTSVTSGTAIKDWPQKYILELLYTVFKARWGALCGTSSFSQS